MCRRANVPVALHRHLKGVFSPYTSCWFALENKVTGDGEDDEAHRTMRPSKRLVAKLKARVGSMLELLGITAFKKRNSIQAEAQNSQQGNATVPTNTSSSTEEPVGPPQCCPPYDPDAPVLYGTVWHADPVIWQINRQIRAKARSLYMNHFLSFDIRGTNRKRWFVENRPFQQAAGMRRLAKWYKSVDEDTVAQIRAVEFRDIVALLYEKDFPMEIVIDGKAYRRDPRYPPVTSAECAAFKIELNVDGTVLKISTPPRLAKSNILMLNDIATNVVTTAIEEGRYLNGHDILTINGRLKYYAGIKAHENVHMALGAECISTQFTMHVSPQHVTWCEWDPFSVKKVEPGWRYTPFIARLEGGQASYELEDIGEDDISENGSNRCTCCGYGH